MLSFKKASIYASLLGLYCASAIGQTVITNSTATPSGCDGGPRSTPPIGICFNGGAYVLGGSVSAIDIVGDGVSIDLAGLVVGGGGVGVCPDASLGNTCTGTPGSFYGLYITGKNARIRNGEVRNVSGTGILATGENVSLTDLFVHDNNGDGGDVGIGSLRNVLSRNNNGQGIHIEGGTVDGAYVTHNNTYGIYDPSSTVMVSNSTIRNNSLGGVFLIAGQVNNVTSSYNGSYGFASGSSTQFINATAIGNSSDGFYTVGGAGGIIQSLAYGNLGYGFNLSNSTCYQNITTVSNTIGTVTGGAAYGIGTVCAH